MTNTNNVLGPLLVDVEGTQLSSEDREILAHPLVGGVILFSRNYESRMQLDALVKTIRELRTPRLLVTVDHEGGRVQRFREGFTRLPPLRDVGRVFDKDKNVGEKTARAIGEIIAYELRQVGIDLSYAPILDIDHRRSEVIGDRSFHEQVGSIVSMASAFIAGLRAGGMSCVGKHFPGHGYVQADSHLELPRDDRKLQRIIDRDLKPFEFLSQQLDAVMPAHVIYEAVDPDFPAGFSRPWLQEYLRDRCGFKGVIISDDLSMQATTPYGSYVERAKLAEQAGCDLYLVCNNRAAVVDLLEHYVFSEFERSTLHIEKLKVKDSTVTRQDHVSAKEYVARSLESIA